MWSPHGFAEECAGWRRFRHLTYQGIRSYVVSVMESVKDTAPALGERGREARLYYDFFRFPGSSYGIEEELDVLRREGLVSPAPWLRCFLRVAAGGLDHMINPGTLWAKSPEESIITFKIGRRLGVSCYLCGIVSRGRDALTTDRRLAEAWHTGPGEPPRESWRGATAFLRPLCEGCMTPDAYDPIVKMFREMRERLS